jgi:hypothetical protein
MGISYQDLDYLLRRRKLDRFGFKSMALDFIKINEGKKSREKCIEIVKKYYSTFCSNRHKTCVLPPGIHLTKYSAENDRYDRRPLFYSSDLLFEEKMLQRHLQKEDLAKKK